jgi:gamma-glutamyltranspeptidase / glutathione hydrolase
MSKPITPAAKFPANPFGSSRSPVMCAHGAVATSQPLAALAGMRALQQGGTAIDAAITAAAVLNVVEPMSTGVGGDAFGIFYDARSANVTALNGSGRSPKAASYDELRRRLTGSDLPPTSPLTWMVPGTVHAWSAALQYGGRMSLRETLAPAIDIAESGFPVAPQTAAVWSASEKALAANPESAKTWLLSGNRAPRAGELFRCPDLARTLRAIAEGGCDVFYSGSIAEAIVGLSHLVGGLFTKTDFSEHRSDFVDVLRGKYRGYEVLAMPPNSQGVASLEALALLDGFDIPSQEPGSADVMHLQIEAMKIALQDAHRVVGDESGSKAEGLLARDYVESQRQRIKRNEVALQPAAAAMQGDTVYIAAVDADGNAASFINSVYMPWGSGYTVPNTGVVLQNRGHCFSLDPDSPNAFGPGKRSRHTLSPAMVVSDGRPLLVFGFVGGDMQVQAQVQFLSNVIDFGMNVQAALDAPRWRYEGSGAAVALENSVYADVRSNLSYRGHHITGSDGFFGGGQAIFVDSEFGTLQAGSDNRRDGCAVGY